MTASEVGLDRRPPTTNVHLCFYARRKEQVDAFHRAGVEAGFRSNGAPGYRDYAPGYYAAYLRDRDGNNVETLYRHVGNIGHGERAALHRPPRVAFPHAGPAEPRVSHEPDSLASGLGVNSFQCPSETTSTVPSVTLMAV